MASVSEILTHAADLLEKPGAWTQGQCARGEDERWPSPEEDSATCWCGVGAVMRIAYFRCGPYSSEGGVAIEVLHSFAKERGLSSFAAFNDTEGRTQAEVVAALRTAASQTEGAA